MTHQNLTPFSPGTADSFNVDLGNNLYPARIIFSKCRADQFTLLLKAKQQTGIIPWRVIKILLPSLPLHGPGPRIHLGTCGIHTHTSSHRLRQARSSPGLQPPTIPAQPSNLTPSNRFLGKFSWPFTQQQELCQFGQHPTLLPSIPRILDTNVQRPLLALDSVSLAAVLCPPALETPLVFVTTINTRVNFHLSPENSASGPATRL